ncbi:histone-lysine N-methyltransferase trithorax [Sabethes cyaneus]|uniref:histone-lysine N-methyltransferase trithorax n=1 Tax=Sabethes cyaneus TaxID=53552 RepID=UPI00237DD70C|nr:histone-lysine N-methyltransferase trithorax [Sabethes cyaneus]
MGKSKFPGKPSRLVNKKRVSVLSSAGLNTLASSGSSDEDNNQNQQQENSTTTEKLNQQSLLQAQQQQQRQQQQQQHKQPSPKVSTLLDNEEIDQDGDDDVSKHAADDSENGEDDDDEDDDDEDDDDDEEDDEEDDEDEDEGDNDAEERNGTDHHEGRDGEDRNGDRQESPNHPAEQKDDECPTNGAESKVSTLNSNDKQTPLTQPPTGNSFEMKPSSLSAISSTLNKPIVPKEPPVEQSTPSSEPTMTTSSSSSGENVAPNDADTNNVDVPVKPKKKTVTFHTTLATSDENMVKKVYNPAIVPLIPIIKKECLARPIRLKKSFNRKMKKRLQRLAMQAASAAAKSECIVRPSRLTEIVLKSSKLDEATASSEPTSSFSAGSNNATSGEIRSVTPSQDAVSFGASGDPSEARNLASGGTQFGDKRFILPKRSAHSSRVIKPNKRFLDEFELEIKKKNKNLAAAQAAAAAAATAAVATAATPTGSSSSSSSANVGKICSKENSDDKSNFFGDKFFKNEACSKNEEDDSSKSCDDNVSEKSEDGKKKREKVKKDTQEQGKKAGKVDGKDLLDPADGEPIRSASSISNPFAKATLPDNNNSSISSNNSNTPTNPLLLVKPSVLSSTTSSLSSPSASSNPSAGSASISSIFGKSILRQPRLQFTTSLLNSNPLAATATNASAAPSPSTAAVGKSSPTTASLSTSASSSSPPSLSSSLVPSAVTDGPFSLHLKPGTNLDSSKIFSSALTAALVSSGSSVGTPLASATVSSSCSICGIAANSRYYQQATKKFGVSCCDVCRKFISKMIKKLASSSSPTHGNGTMKCKNEGKCSIGPPTVTRPDHVKTRHIFKERCHACWLRKCLIGFQVPPVLKVRLTQTLPASLRQFENQTSSVSLIKRESIENNIFSSSLSSSSKPSLASRGLWNVSGGDKPEFGKANPFQTLANPLAQNNSTFGSLPSIKLNISDKPAIMAPSSMSSPKDNKNPSTESSEQPTVPEKEKRDSDETEPTEVAVNSIRTRSKTEAAANAAIAGEITPTSVATSSTVATSTNASSTTTVTAAAVTDTSSTVPGDKRQRIDLKGPRVKHVCRSASIVLGQPLATFPDDENDATAATLENIETPPSDSAADVTDQLPETPLRPTTPKINDDYQCTECKEPENLTLSPPVTPVADADTSGSTEKELVIDEDQLLPESSPTASPTKELTAVETVDKAVDEPTISSEPITNVKIENEMKEKEQPPKKAEEIERPTTRKATSLFRPQGLKQNINAITKSFNTSARTAGQGLVAELPNIPLISIDFWENYDPAEVSRTGFGLILSEDVPLKALCFLCGSAGLDELLFCVCCCEPYHQYCVKDEYNIRTGSLDDTGVSLLELTTHTGHGGSVSPHEQALSRFNWMCPRCTVCYTCNMAAGSKVKCQKCDKNYHTTCLGTSKRLLGADRPLICAACLKCKSCSTTNVTKFIGNLPMCTPCFRLRQKGNFCPLCQRCYEDNDFDLKMMECGDCKRWVHAKCEGLTDEQYNMLSALPENIEFICKKCGKNNENGNVWRDAVAAEFKAGLFSVVKLLSKSRQACALLKLSPRKKTSNCTCSVSSGKSINFFSFGATSKDESSGSTSKRVKLEQEQESIYDFNSENSSSNSSFPPTSKCYCSIRPVKPSDISLVEIKQKINASEYYSLQDFNYDMNTLINAIGSEDLSTAYKEFLSETFPWFQNETKACTDALEEAMCGEEMCDYNPVTTSSDMVMDSTDQKVPSGIDIPLDDIGDYFYESTEELKDNRICMFCKQQGEGLPMHESRLLYCGQNNWVHTNCALWTAEVFEEIDGSLQNVHSAASRGRSRNCRHCGVKGATVRCNAKSCAEHYHFPCARQVGCTFMQDKSLFCPQHANEATRKKCAIERNFEINRSVYVELDRRKKKFVEPGKVQFMIGSLSVKKLGHIVPMFSDYSDYIVPTDFECTRLYWSWKEPWKIVQYRIKTTIQNNNYCNGTDFGRNFTVDHSSNQSLVQWGLTQINRWHHSLSTGDEHELEPIPSSSGAHNGREKPTKHLLETATGDDTNDEEPQNNQDLLPQEIKDAIFEDIPHDILDGISMLDILPKLMTYDDLIAMDLKNENNFNAEILKEVGLGGVGNSSSNSSNSSGATGGTKDDDMDVDEDDINEAIMKCTSSDLSNDGWMKSISNPGIEDALLSAIKQPSSCVGGNSRELKRSKSDILSRAVSGGRVSTQPRSGSFSWNSKLETVAKRRKISKLADVLSLGRIKDESSMQERRRFNTSSEEFNWSAATRKISGETLSDGMSVFEKLKISQLDGMDDFCGDAGEVKIYSTSMIEAPVRCDRCHASYRNQESYQRHLSSCEVLSTSESDSETRSPRLLSPEQQQAQVTSQLGNGTFILPQTSTSQAVTADIYGQINQGQQSNPTISVISGLNNQTINLGNLNNQAILSNIPASMGITINQLPSGIPIQTSTGTQQIPIQGTFPNLSGNMIISNQGQIFAQPMNFQQSLDTAQPTFVQNKQRFIQPTQTAQIPQTITLSNNGLNVIQQQPQQQPQQQQQQIITIGPNGQQQIVTVAASPQPQQQATILQNHAQKKQLTYPTVSPKKQSYSKIPHSPTPIKAKRTVPTSTVTSNPKTIQIKKQEPITIQQAATPQPQAIQALTAQPQQQQQIQLINTSYPLIRPASSVTPQQTSATAGNPIIFQQANHQPIIVQQVGGNQISYVTDQNPVQYLATPNVLTQNGFAMATTGEGTLAAVANNILVPNGTGGYSMIPASALQLTTPQPQVIGTIIQPQATTIQCGMMSTEQMVLGAAAPTPTLEMVTDPTSGCMYLTSPSVYYGLETIVQNTVMSSQQFVSTAMQGVLSQNSSFSATTTQVFQASKIEPIVEVPTGYVVLNNDGTTSQQSLAPMQLQSAATAGIIQQQAQIQPSVTPAPHAQALQATVSVSQPGSIQTWKLEPQQNTVVQHQQHHQSQTTAVNPLKSNSGIKSIIPKSQPQLVNKVMPNPMIKTSASEYITAPIASSRMNFQPVMTTAAIYTTSATALTTTSKVSNVIKPITKSSQPLNKPKIIAKPVKQRQTLLSPPLSSPQSPQMHLNAQQQQKPNQQHNAQIGLPITNNNPQLVQIKPSINNDKPIVVDKVVSQPMVKISSKNVGDFISTVNNQPPKPVSLLKKPDIKTISRVTNNSTFQTTQGQMPPQQPQCIQINVIPTSNFMPSVEQQPTAVQSTAQPQPTKPMMSITDAKKKPSQMTMTLAPSCSTAPSAVGSHTITNSSITITPTQTASITLPTTPYLMPLYSNIPTNVVNPIQQSNMTNNNVNNNNGTNPPGMVQNRPTNRVLPMQASAILPKSPEVPQTPPPLKLLNAMPDKIDDISIIPSHTFSPEHLAAGLQQPDKSPLKEPQLEIEIKPIEMLSHSSPHQGEDQLDAAIDQHHQLQQQQLHHHQQQQHQQQTPQFQFSLSLEHHDSLMGTPVSSASPMAEIEIKPLDVVSSMPTLAETEEMLADSMQQEVDPLDSASSVNSPSLTNDESESPEIKNKISEILDNLEQQTNEEDAYSECQNSDSTELLLKIENEQVLEASSSPIKSQQEQQLVEELNQELQAASAHASPAGSSPSSTGCELIIPPIFESSDPKKDDDSGYEAEQKDSYGRASNITSPTPSSSSNPLTSCSSESQTETLIKVKSNEQLTGKGPSPPPPKTNSPKLLYEIQSQDGFTYKSTSIVEIWDKLFEAVQIARKAHGLQPLPEGQLEEMAGVQMLGLKTNAMRYLLEQLPGVEKCSQYKPQYHHKKAASSVGDGASAATLGGISSIYADYFDIIKENPYGAARCEPYSARSEYDMFSWLASRHRKQPMPVVAQSIDDTIIPRRGSGSNLPMAMRYRTLKETSKESVGVYRSHIHGRGLFCNRDIEAGEMVIEYAGELIRSTLTDKRERYYDSRGIGCYMFKIDENFVVDATMRGNAARFINHSCEPNCYSKVVDILGHKHIIIFAYRRIVQGEELTYDYKFPFEDVKIPCSCGSKKCRKYLN